MDASIWSGAPQSPGLLPDHFRGCSSRSATGRYTPQNGRHNEYTAARNRALYGNSLSGFDNGRDSALVVNRVDGSLTERYYPNSGASGSGIHDSSLCQRGPITVRFSI